MTEWDGQFRHDTQAYEKKDNNSSEEEAIGSAREPSTIYGRTLKATLLVNIPLGVLTVTKPEVAPAGTVAVSKLLDLTANETAVPFNMTAVVPLML